MSVLNNRQDNIPVGVSVIVGTVMMMALADAIIKFLSSDVPLWQIFVIRSSIALPILFFLLPRAELSTHFGGALWWVVIRSLILTLMYVAIYAAAPILDLSVIAAVLYTGPLFTTLFSAWINKEKVSAVSWCGIIGGFAGVMLIIKPATDAFHIAMLIPMIAAILYAMAAIITRGKCAHVRPVVLATALNITLIGFGGAMTMILFMVQPFISGWVDYPFLLGPWIEMGQREWIIMTVLAVLIILIGIGLAKAYQCAPSVIIASFDYSYLLFVAFWGFIFFSEVPDAMSVVGMILIAGAGLLVMSMKKTDAI